MKKSIAVALLALLLVSPLHAQKDKTLGTGLSVGDTVVIVVPTQLMNLNRTGALGINFKMDTYVRMNGGVVEVFDTTSGMWRNDWRSVGFFPTHNSWLTPQTTAMKMQANQGSESYTIQKIKIVTHNNSGKNEKFIEATVNINVVVGKDNISSALFRVFAPIDQPDAISSVIVPVTLFDSVQVASYKAIGDRVFVGTMDSITTDDRLLILKWMNYTAHSNSVEAETYKDITYMSIVITTNTTIWNDSKVSRNERLSATLDDQLSLLKSFGELATRYSTVFGGVKITDHSSHATFTTKTTYYGTSISYENNGMDMIEAYIPIVPLIEFSNADITSQELIDKSIILVNNNRIKIDLSDR